MISSTVPKWSVLEKRSPSKHCPKFASGFLLLKPLRFSLRIQSCRLPRHYQVQPLRSHRFRLAHPRVRPSACSVRDRTVRYSYRNDCIDSSCVGSKQLSCPRSRVGRRVLRGHEALSCSPTFVASLKVRGCVFCLLITNDEYTDSYASGAFAFSIRMSGSRRCSRWWNSSGARLSAGRRAWHWENNFGAAVHG